MKALTGLLITLCISLATYLVKSLKSLKSEKEYYTGNEKETLKLLNETWKKRYIKALRYYLSPKFINIDVKADSEQRAWVFEIVKTTKERHIYGENDRVNFLKFYDIELNKSILYNWENSDNAREPFKKSQNTWEKQSIDTIALDLGLDINREDVKKLLLKMG